MWEARIFRFVFYVRLYSKEIVMGILIGVVTKVVIVINVVIVACVVTREFYYVLCSWYLTYPRCLEVCNINYDFLL